MTCSKAAYVPYQFMLLMEEAQANTFLFSLTPWSSNVIGHDLSVQNGQETVYAPYLLKVFEEQA